MVAQVNCFGAPLGALYARKEYMPIKRASHKPCEAWGHWHKSAKRNTMVAVFGLGDRGQVSVGQAMASVGGRLDLDVSPSIV